VRLTAYDVLGVPEYATPENIKRRYHTLAKRYHPDVYKATDAHERMKTINLAYQAIQDGRGRFWTPPIEQSAPEKPELPPMAEMIAFANEHEVDDAYLLTITVGGRDEYSRMLDLAELVELAGHVVTAKVVEAIGYKAPHYHRKLVKSALRWYLRGLKVELAIRKAYIDDQFYRSQGSRQKDE